MVQLFASQLNELFVRSPEEIAFMNLNQDLSKDEIFSMQKNPFSYLLPQIFSRKQIKEKLPFLYQQLDIVYPAVISLEQSSSEKTAMFKANLFAGKKMIDLSGGMGIDTYFFSKKFDAVIYVERNQILAEITSHNFAVLKATNIDCAIGQNSVEFIKESKSQFDLIYIDPARRSEVGGKLYKLEDCEPNLIEILPDLLHHSNQILIKTSPLLDIQLAAQHLSGVKNVYVVAVNNECRELLFHLEKKYTDDYTIHAINMQENGNQEFTFSLQNEQQAVVEFGPISTYLYEPNAAILKAGGFKSISLKYQIQKLHKNAHLYTSSNLIVDFPGRVFEVSASLKVDKKQLSSLLPSMQANVSIRNFPGTVAELKKKLGLKDGGDCYVFGTTNHLNEKVLLLTKKVVF